ncbi:MAG: 2-hydroxyacyl-CoA dehydratase [Rhodocyclaceae bacterium]|nr:MAG: 2-hydroxyacyl-CoA dehydratase [Rhodocyclaceae bacterium]
MNKVASPSANSNPSFGLLQEAYSDRFRAARSAYQSGKAIVGYVGNTVPVELIAAAGCFPLRVAPISGSTTSADRYVESFADIDTRLITELFIAGELDFLSLLIIPRSTESYHKLYLSLRELKRVGAAQAGPDLLLYEILHTQSRISRQYGLKRTRELADRLSAIGNTEVGDDTLLKAIASTNQTRTLLARIQAARYSVDQSVSGYEAFTVMGAGRFLDREYYNRVLTEWIDSSARSPGAGPRLLVKGCPLDHPYLHRQVEFAGGRVVAEDDDWGARGATPLIGSQGTPLEAIFDHYFSQVPCPRVSPDSVAQEWFNNALRTAPIDGVIFYLPVPDDVYGWDFPRQRDAVERAGLKWTMIRGDVRYAANHAEADAILNSLVASLEPAYRANTNRLATIS